MALTKTSAASWTLNSIEIGAVRIALRNSISQTRTPNQHCVMNRRLPGSRRLLVAMLLSQVLAQASIALGKTNYPPAYPRTPFVVDVTQPPYSAKGDGITDDTEPLQHALNEAVGRNRALYFPKGTYLISRTLTWPKKWNGRENWGFTMLRGQHRDQVILRLKNHNFTDATQPQALMWCGGFGSADWFHNYVEDITI